MTLRKIIISWRNPSEGPRRYACSLGFSSDRVQPNLSAYGLALLNFLVASPVGVCEFRSTCTSNLRAALIPGYERIENGLRSRNKTLVRPVQFSRVIPRMLPLDPRKSAAPSGSSALAIVQYRVPLQCSPQSARTITFRTL